MRSQNPTETPTSKKKISREEQERRKKKVENYGELEVIYISTNNNKQWVTT